MFSNDFNNSGTYDSTIGYTRAIASACSGLEITESQLQEYLCIFANGFNDGFNIRLDFATHTSNARTIHNTREPSASFCDRFDAIFRCWGNQGYYFNTMLMRIVPKFTFSSNGISGAITPEMPTSSQRVKNFSRPNTIGFKWVIMIRSGTITASSPIINGVPYRRYREFYTCRQTMHACLPLG